MRMRIGVVLSVCALIVWGAVFTLQTDAQIHAPFLSVQFLDVGQGDALLLETPDGVQVLIDGGPDATVLQALNTAMGFRDRTIDMVLATHEDSDHISGLVDVLERYTVQMIVTTDNHSDTPVATAFAQAAAHEGAIMQLAHAGQTYALGASTTMTVLFPQGSAADMESNTASLVVLVRYGDTTFLLSGDAPQSIERYLVSQYGAALRSDVLKLGHHGSKTSSSEEWLTVVAPTYAIVSAGVNNTYGHPHAEVVERARMVGATLLSTAEVGTITFYSDGTRVWLGEK